MAPQGDHVELPNSVAGFAFVIRFPDAQQQTRWAAPEWTEAISELSLDDTRLEIHLGEGRIAERVIHPDREMLATLPIEAGGWLLRIGPSSESASRWAQRQLQSFVTRELVERYAQSSNSRSVHDQLRKIAPELLQSLQKSLPMVTWLANISNSSRPALEARLAGAARVFTLEDRGGSHLALHDWRPHAIGAHPEHFRCQCACLFLALAGESVEPTGAVERVEHLSRTPGHSSSLWWASLRVLGQSVSHIEAAVLDRQLPLDPGLASEGFDLLKRTFLQWWKGGSVGAGLLLYLLAKAAPLELASRQFHELLTQWRDDLQVPLGKLTLNAALALADLVEAITDYSSRKLNGAVEHHGPTLEVAWSFPPQAYSNLLNIYQASGGTTSGNTVRLLHELNDYAGLKADFDHENCAITVRVNANHY